MMCKCGCRGAASYIVESFEYDPAAKGRRGAAFSEPACINAMLYLRDGASEFGFPFAARKIDGGTR